MLQSGHGSRPARPAGGTPQDITLASLRVEHMFSADEATRAILIAEVG